MPQVVALPSVSSEALGRARWISVTEIFIAWNLIEATIWTSGKTQSHLFWVSASFILATTALNRPRLRELGLALHGLGSTLWVVPAAATIAAMAVLISKWLGTVHPLFGVVGVATHSIAYFVWAIFQQFILQSYFFLRFERLLSAARAVIASAVLFALAHLPNPVLIAVCLPAGWVACEIFRRGRNIYALGVAHAILGLTLAVTVPDHIQRHMRVGIGYYHYHSSTEATPVIPLKHVN